MDSTYTLNELTKELEEQDKKDLLVRRLTWIFARIKQAVVRNPRPWGGWAVVSVQLSELVFEVAANGEIYLWQANQASYRDLPQLTHQELREVMWAMPTLSQRLAREHEELKPELDKIFGRTKS